MSFARLPCSTSFRHSIRPTDRLTNSCIAVLNRRYSVQNGHDDIGALFQRPKWSVRSLLADVNDPSSPGVTSQELRHLLRLSALPPPKDDAEEQQMLRTLQSQLRFVQHIQKVDTEGVEPLQSVRDDSSEGRKAREVGIEDVRHVMDKEQRTAGGNMIKRQPRHVRTENRVKEDWNVLGHASRTVGRYFVVEKGSSKD